MKKILVIGGNGSGKTTFAKVLSEELNIPLVHIDKIARTDNWKRVSDDIFDDILNEEISKDSWIIDGNDTRTLPNRLKHCDTIFYFDFSTVACLNGVINRTMQNYGQHRDDVGGENNIEKFDIFKLYFFKALMNFWENEMKSKGEKVLMLSTESDNIAQNLYYRLGYKCIGELDLQRETKELMMLKKIY